MDPNSPNQPQNNEPTPGQTVTPAPPNPTPTPQPTTPNNTLPSSWPQNPARPGVVEPTASNDSDMPASPTPLPSTPVTQKRSNWPLIILALVLLGIVVAGFVYFLA